MDIRERHFGSIATSSDDGRETTVDLDALIRHLLLFEHYYLESNQLTEIPAMVNVFGYNGVRRLVEDSKFDIICDAMTAGSVGQTVGLQVTAKRGTALPLGSYRIVSVTLPANSGFHHALANMRDTPGLSGNRRKNLEAALQQKLIRYPTTAAITGMEDFARDLEAGEAKILPVVRNVVHEGLGFDVGPKLQVAVERLPFEGDYRVQTNLQTDFKVDDQSAHKLVERALLGIAGLNQRLRLMESFEAVTGFQEADAPFFEARLGFIWAQLDPGAQERRFERVSKLAGLPSIATLGADATVDIDKLLRLRDDPDCVDLRRWLRSTDGQSDEDIAQQFNSVREKLAALLHSAPGKALRFVVTSGIGAIPGAGLVLGPLSTLADQFIADKLIGSPGPVCFLSRRYRSIYKPR